MMNEALLGIYIISFPMTLILLWIWKTKLHHPVRYRKPVFFPFHLYLFALAEREWFIIFCHAMCMIEELCYITQNWTETIK